MNPHNPKYAFAKHNQLNFSLLGYTKRAKPMYRNLIGKMKAQIENDRN